MSSTSASTAYLTQSPLSFLPCSKCHAVASEAQGRALALATDQQQCDSGHLVCSTCANNVHQGTCPTCPTSSTNVDVRYVTLPTPAASRRDDLAVFTSPLSDAIQALGATAEWQFMQLVQSNEALRKKVEMLEGVTKRAADRMKSLKERNDQAELEIASLRAQLGLHAPAAGQGWAQQQESSTSGGGVGSGRQDLGFSTHRPGSAASSMSHAGAKRPRMSDESGPRERPPSQAGKRIDLSSYAFDPSRSASVAPGASRQQQQAFRPQSSMSTSRAPSRAQHSTQSPQVVLSNSSLRPQSFRPGEGQGTAPRPSSAPAKGSYYDQLKRHVMAPRSPNRREPLQQLREDEEEQFAPPALQQQSFPPPRRMQPLAQHQPDENAALLRNQPSRNGTSSVRPVQQQQQQFRPLEPRQQLARPEDRPGTSMSHRSSATGAGPPQQQYSRYPPPSAGYPRPATTDGYGSQSRPGIQALPPAPRGALQQQQRGWTSADRLAGAGDLPVGAGTPRPRAFQPRTM